MNAKRNATRESAATYRTKMKELGFRQVNLWVPDTRSANVAQASLFNETHASIAILPLSSSVVDAPLFRLTIDPTRQNGLTRVSQVMVDKAITVPREKIGKVIGKLGDDAMIRVTRALAVWLGIA